MATEIVNIPDYIKSLFEKIENVKISKTDDEWDSLNKLDKIKEIKYLISKYKKLHIGYELLNRLSKTTYRLSPLLLLLLILIGVKLLTSILISLIIFLVFFIFNNITRKKSIICSLEVYLFEGSLKREIGEYY